MKINIIELNSKLEEFTSKTYDEQLAEILKYLGNYENITMEEYTTLFFKCPKLLSLVKTYLGKYPEANIVDINLQNLVDACIYLDGLSEARELGINVDDYNLSDNAINDLHINNYDSVKLYINSLNFPVLSREEEQELAKRMLQGDMMARNKLIECNLKLVVFIASQIVRSKGEVIPFMEMIGEGNSGLIHGIDKYDFKRKTKISTYVTGWIINRIRLAIDNQAKDILKPVRFNETYKKYKQMLVLMGNVLGRDATKYEVAKLLGISLEELDDFENRNGKFISINTPVGKDEDNYLYEIIPDETLPPVYEQFDNNYLSEELKRIISTLPEKQAKIIYGLFYENKTLEQVGNENNITRERVRQINVEVLKKLRKRTDIKNLAIYITDKDVSELQGEQLYENDKFSIQKFNKKNNLKRKNDEINYKKMYDKMKVVCKNLQDGNYSYEDLAIDIFNVKKKTIN